MGSSGRCRRGRINLDVVRGGCSGQGPDPPPRLPEHEITKPRQTGLDLDLDHVAAPASGDGGTDHLDGITPGARRGVKGPTPCRRHRQRPRPTAFVVGITNAGQHQAGRPVVAGVARVAPGQVWAYRCEQHPPRAAVCPGPRRIALSAISGGAGANFGSLGLTPVMRDRLARLTIQRAAALPFRAASVSAERMPGCAAHPTISMPVSCGRGTRFHCLQDGK